MEDVVPVASFRIEDVQLVVGDVGEVVQMFLAGVNAEDSLSGATCKPMDMQIQKQIQQIQLGKEDLVIVNMAACRLNSFKSLHQFINLSIIIMAVGRWTALTIDEAPIDAAGVGHLLIGRFQKFVDELADVFQNSFLRHVNFTNRLCCKIIGKIAEKLEKLEKLDNNSLKSKKIALLDN